MRLWFSSHHTNVRDEFCGPGQIGVSPVGHYCDVSQQFKNIRLSGPILSNKFFLLMELNICVCFSLQGNRYLQQKTWFDRFGVRQEIVQFVLSLDECVCCGLSESWGWAGWCGFILWGKTVLLAICSSACRAPGFYLWHLRASTFQVNFWLELSMGDCLLLERYRKSGRGILCSLNGPEF